MPPSYRQQRGDVMDSMTPEQMRTAVRSQANIRVKLGLPVAIAALALNLVSGNDSPQPQIIGIAVLSFYTLYVIGTYVITRHPGPLLWKDIAFGTAILDPLILSAWLFTEGEQAILVMAFYLFTILGFGFRIGPNIMRICQAVSIIGFSFVLFESPFWVEHLSFGISHLVLLIVVPMYAGSLMKELRQAKAHAESESKAKSQLLANVSHELRTPLTGIVSAAQLLEHKAKSPDDARLAQSIVSLSGSLDAEISQLLDLSKLSMQTSGPPGPFHLRSVMDSIQAALQEAATTKGLTFIADVDPAIKNNVVGRAHELTSILMNLAGNAVKFTHEGTVAVQIKRLGEDHSSYRLWIGVKDTGIGISEDHLKRLFEPFYRVENGDRRQYRGTGLGTTIALEHVRRMGSDLHVTSKPGEGSTFWFEVTMPISKLEVAIPQQAATPIVSPKSVLIADDNALNLELLEQMLARDGHHVTVAGSGKEAIEHLSSSQFDVVMLDFNMADLDGLSVYQMYAFGRLYPAPTFFVTADTSIETASKLNNSGAAGVVYKPLTFEKLRGAIASVFPTDSSTVVRIDTAAADRAAGHLAAVPVEHIDLSILDTLREIKDTPAFIHKMISDGMHDIEMLLEQLTSAIAATDTPAVHQRAHAMKGVALNIGALRLGAQCERLMSITTTQLQAGQDRLRSDIVSNTKAALGALDELRAPFADTSTRIA